MKLDDLVHFPMMGETNFTLADILFMGNVKTLLIVQKPKGESQAEVLKKEMSESSNSLISNIVVHCVPSGIPKGGFSYFNQGYEIQFEKVGFDKNIMLGIELMIVEEEGKITVMRYTDFPSTIFLSKHYFGRL